MDMNKRSAVKIAALLPVIVFISIILLFTQERRQKAERFKQIQIFLSRDSLENYDTEREIMTLSFISDGLLRKYQKEPESRKVLAPLARKSAELALKAHPFIFHDKSHWKDQGLLLAHTNIILGACLQISQDSLYSGINREISLYLAKEMANSPYHTMKSYPEMEDRWPVDNATILYSLYLYDQNNKTAVSVPLIKNWLRVMKERGTDQVTGLYVSEITGCEIYSNIPRGCSLSLIAVYMKRFAPHEADELWRNYKKSLKKSLFFIAGFREYPKESNAVEDYDSGPILFDFGGAATGLGLPASVIMEDNFTARQIRNGLHLMDLIIFISRDPVLQYERNTMTAQSILFLAD